MKRYITLIAVLALGALAACDDLDRFPLDNPSSGTFFERAEELEVAVNRFYTSSFFREDNSRWGDNEWNRSGNGNSFLAGTNTSQTGTFANAWSDSYTAIDRANTVLANIDRPSDYLEGQKDIIEGQALLTRAFNYGLLALRFGNVPLITEPISDADARQIMQSSRADVFSLVFSDLDRAASLLPANYNGVQRMTRGFALSLKARYALYNGEYAMAAQAAQEVINSGEYGLFSDYRNLFLTAGQNSEEVIFAIPRSITFNDVYNIRFTISRNAGGWASNIPTLTLVDSYECTDGLPIDESPLYDQDNPFENRDPRLAASIVVPGDEWLGFEFDSRPSARNILNLTTGTSRRNNDSPSRNRFASFVGLLIKKSIPNEAGVDWRNQDIDNMIMRYAEILLTYAEAKLEMNDIDQSVLDAVNAVRARAYGVDISDVANYPAVTTTNQAELRRILRRERRVEFAFEGLRYRDILRWGIADQVFNRALYGYPEEETAGWPIGGTPQIDANGLMDYSGFANDLTVIYQTVFDPAKHNLWAIPFGELILNENLEQNPGY